MKSFVQQLQRMAIEGGSNAFQPSNCEATLACLQVADLLIAGVHAPRQFLQRKATCFSEFPDPIFHVPFSNDLGDQASYKTLETERQPDWHLGALAWNQILPAIDRQQFVDYRLTKTIQSV
jgi:hypothetical protein